MGGQLHDGRGSEWARVVLWAVLCSSCTAPTFPEAAVTSVTPARVWRGVDVPITIEGENFFPGIEVDARGYGTDLDRNWEAFLVSGGARAPLLGESLESETRLRALVPAGLDPDDYTLELVSPAGVVVSSSVGLEVTESQEAAFTVSYYDAPSAYVAGEQVRFLVQAVGLDNERVYADVPVAVTLEGAATELGSTVAFDDVAILPGGSGFTGVLPDGSAVLVVDLLAPGRLDVTAESPPSAPDLQPGSLTLVVGGGSELPATIEVPEEVLGSGVEAGVAFDVVVSVFDQRGERVEEPLDLTLGNRCGGFEADVVVRGATSVPVALTRATQSGSDCDEDAIVVVQGAVGQSEPFDVRGGPATGFELFTLSFDLQAGQPDIVAVVRPRDAWDNTTSWSGVLTVSDDLGSLTATSCQAGPQLLVCSATPTVAGDPVTVTVRDDKGLTASLPGYRIVPSPSPAELTLGVPARVRAGLTAEVTIGVLDAWGNQLLASQVDPVGITFDSDASDAACLVGAVNGDGTVDAACTFTVAREDGVLLAFGGGATGGLATSVPLAVENGLVASVGLTAPAVITAGQGFSLGLAAYDAFGNPYLTQDDPVLDLADGSGTLTVDQALLTPAGQATVLTTIPRSGTWSVTASQGGLLLGTSAPILVVPGPTQGLSVDVDAPWGEVDEPVDVVVQAVDSYGNRTALSESLTVSSRLTSTPSQVLALVNGVATLSWTWSARAVDEVLDASSGSGFLGASDPLYVVRDCPSGGPTTTLLLGGSDIGLVCFDEASGVGGLTADLSLSTPGLEPLVGYGLAASGPDEVAVVGGADVVDVELGAVGSYAVRAIVVDADACAHEVTSQIYVGLDDGTPTGPIELSPTVTLLDVADSTSVDLVSVTDCAGDPAGSAQVRLRASGGVLPGATATGTGLVVTLDAFGDGVTDLVTLGDVADNGPSGGSLELVAWTPSGSAGGGTAVTVSGDAIRPTVLDQSPRGATTGLIDTVVVELSEDLLPSSVLPSRFLLTGPGGSVVTDASLAGGQVTLTIDPPADADAGAWFLTVTDDVRDLSGNRLSGDWSGDRSDYVGAFGDVGAPPAAVSCPTVTPTGGLFRPDGDDGVGADADEVLLQLEAATAPAWWVAEVRDDEGELLVQRWTIPGGASDTWSWDGRDGAGFVAPNGTYTITVRSDDGFGNRGTGCVVQAVVDNPSGGQANE